MRVFVTGATGFLGSAIVERLLARGHRVTGLARSDRSAQLLTGRGIDVVAGDLGDTEVPARAATEHVAVVHAALSHDDWSALERAFAQEGTAVSTMLSAMAGTAKPFV